MNDTLTPRLVVMVYLVTGLPSAVVPNGALVSDAPLVGARTSARHRAATRVTPRTRAPPLHRLIFIVRVTSCQGE